MQSYKSSATLKSDARELLLGHYKTVVFAYAVIQCILSGCLSLVESQSDFHSIAGNLIYLAVYFILTLFMAVFTTGQFHMYKKLATGQIISAMDIWFAFRQIADTCMLVQLMIIGRILLASIPFIVAVLCLSIYRNFYLAPIVAFFFIAFMIFTVVTLMNYSQVFFLVLDHPSAKASELLSMSHSLMKGHRGRFFYVMVSFWGIYLLVLLTFGIAILWAYPYVTATRTCFYLDLTHQEKDNWKETSPNPGSTNTTINLTA